MKRQLTRREFIRNTALASTGFWIGTRSRVLPGESANEKLNLGIIGVNNRARANIAGVRSQNIVALCDIDDRYLEAAARDFPGAQKYNDFRKLLDQKDLDAVVVSTPDHIHVPASVTAMKRGLHVYCEKPLSHSVWESRVAATTAREQRCVTQLGTQIHAGSNYRRVVEVIRSGAIGTIREAHVWVGKAWGGGDRPKETPPVPAYLHFDLWLGPAPERPYHPTYLPGNWRRWWDFGGGTLGDMGCHHIDVIFWALRLRHPSTVEAEGPPVHPETAPTRMHVKWTFPASGERAPVDIHWYDGGRRPPQFAGGKLPQWGDGVLWVGDKGMMLSDYGRYKLLPEDEFADFKPPEPTIPDSIGHYNEWIDACKREGLTTCNFDYSGALTETVLLGNVAYRSGQRLEWDAASLEVKNSPQAQRLIRRDYREGWPL